MARIQTTKPHQIAADLASRIGTCQGAVTLTVESLLAGNDPGTAISGLLLIERELACLHDEANRLAEPQLRVVPSREEQG